MDNELFLLILIGFLAQLVDGALGMAFGVISTTAVMAIGLPPAQASAMVHAAEVFTTSASGAWHVFYRNIDWRLLTRLAPAGVIGAVLGAYILSNVDGNLIRPFVSAYLLLMGLYILLRAAGWMPTLSLGHLWTSCVGFVAGFLDASGGGGWGPVATSSLVGAGHSPRHAIGSVNTAEFFVTVAATATFLVELGSVSWMQLVPLALGGLFAAPFGGWLTRLIKPRMLMAAVGVLIVLLSLFQLARVLKLS
jgi:uncharacterized membrane protein YfcA